MSLKIFQAMTSVRSVSVTGTASASAALPTAATHVMVANPMSEAVFVAIATGSATATVPTTTAASTCTPVLAGQVAIFSLPTSNTVLNFSVISGGGSGTVYVGTGAGI